MKSLPDPTELVARQARQFSNQRLLVVDPPSPGSLAQLGRLVDVSFLLTRDYGVYKYALTLPDMRDRLSFSLLPKENQDRECALVFVPKGRRLLHMTLAAVAAAGKPGNAVYVVGGNRSGIKSAPKLMEDLLGMTRKVDTARHCQMLKATIVDKERPPVDLAAWLERYPIHLGNREMTVASLPGCFSHGELDEGSRLLMHHWQPGNPTRILDIGCGSGVLGLWLAAGFPSAEVVLSDNHAGAIEAAGQTLALNNITNARVVASDLFDEIDGRFDLIVSNPPFHSGHDTDRVTAYRLIEQAVSHLNPGGSLQLVCNTFLPYAEAMQRSFSEVTTLYRGQRYRVYLGRAPK